MPFHLAALFVGLVGRVPADAAVGTLAVVERHRVAHGLCGLADVCESLPVQELVLHGVVYALGHRVVLRVSVLRHAWDYMAVRQHPDVVGAGILRAAVGVVDEGLVEAFGQRGYGHSQRLDAVCGLKGRRDAPAQDLLAVGVHDDGQEAECVAQAGRGVFRFNVGYVADPYLVGPRWDHALDEVGVGRQVVAGVRCAGSPLDVPDAQPALVHDAAEGVAPYAVLVAEPAPVHPPQIVRAHHRVFLPDTQDELYDKLFQRQAAEQQVVVLLVKGLSCHTGQRTERRHFVPLVPVQPFDCPVPAFFLISMPNISSATSTIVS